MSLRDQTWRRIDCPTSRLPWGDVAQLLVFESLLIINLNHFEIVIADFSRPDDLRVVSRFKPRVTNMWLTLAPEWPALIAVRSGFDDGESGVEVIDLTNPSHPQSQAFYSIDLGSNRAVAFSDDRLMVTSGQTVGVLDKSGVTPVFEVKEEYNTFDTYPTTLLSAPSHLFVQGSDSGLFVLDKNDACVRSVKREFNAQAMHWLTPYSLLLMVSESGVYAVDTSQPAQSKVMPVCKVAGRSLATGLAVRGTEAISATSNSKGATIQVFDFSQPDRPTVKKTSTVKPLPNERLEVDSVALGERHLVLSSVYLEHLVVLESD